MVTLDTAKQFSVQVTPVDTNGNPGLIDGPPTYAASPTGFVTLVPSADGLTCVVKGTAAGTCTVTPTALAKGVSITGGAIQVVVTIPLQEATKLNEAIGPVVPQT